MRKVFLCVLCCCACASVFAKTAEVDLINPNEPEANLGDAAGENNSAAAAPRAEQTISDVVLTNVKNEFVPFLGGRGSFNQKDTTGGLLLFGTQLLTNGFACATIYYSAEYYFAQTFASETAPAFVSEADRAAYDAKLVSDLEYAQTRMKIFGGITLGCFIGETVLAIVRPFVFAKQPAKISFTPVVVPNGLGAVIHF